MPDTRHGRRGCINTYPLLNSRVGQHDSGMLIGYMCLYYCRRRSDRQVVQLRQGSELEIQPLIRVKDLAGLQLPFRIYHARPLSHKGVL